MAFTLVAYNVLKSNINESISTLIKHHDPSQNKSQPIEPSKFEELLERVPAERRVHAKYLMKIITLLDSSNPQIDKARILNAAAYYVRDKIFQSYKYSSPEGSVFYNSLTTSLDLKIGNQPERNDLVDMYGPLEKFIRTHVYKSSDPRKGYLEVQPFDIKDYSVEDDIMDLGSKLKEWRDQIILEVKILHQKEMAAVKKPVKNSSGLLSIFGSTGTKPLVVEEKGTTLTNS